MDHRKQGNTQSSAAAKTGISERSARRIDHGELSLDPSPARHWRTRKDPLATVWEIDLLPALEANPKLLPATLLELLCERYPDDFDDGIARTLQRRIKAWKIKHGPEKEVMFRQTKVPGRMGISDFTHLKGIEITLAGELFTHMLYHYRLVFSGWCYVKITCGGESYTALSNGLQNALWRCGGVPAEHRTDSLAAAFKNASEKADLTDRYDDLCRHYTLKATRNNPAQSHENGAIESAHGHLKRRIAQALMLRGSHDFDSLEHYQSFLDTIVAKINRRCRTRFELERPLLQPLPKRRTHDYAEHTVMISSSSSFDLKRVTYTVPSRFIGQRLYVQLFDERLVLFHGHEQVLALARVYAPTGKRARQVNYRHVIASLARKPQAFRFSQLRDDLLPSPDYTRIWKHVDAALEPHKACRYIVRLLQLAAVEDVEQALGRYVLSGIDSGELPSNHQCAKHFGAHSTVVPLVHAQQHALADYDQLIPQAVSHG